MDKEKFHETFASFINQFKPLDTHSILFLEILFEILLKGNDEQNLPVSSQEK
jgi:hypothetical protein